MYLYFSVANSLMESSKCNECWTCILVNNYVSGLPKDAVTPREREGRGVGQQDSGDGCVPGEVCLSKVLHESNTSLH